MVEKSGLMLGMLGAAVLIGTLSSFWTDWARIFRERNQVPLLLGFPLTPTACDGTPQILNNVVLTLQKPAVSGQEVWITISGIAKENILAGVLNYTLKDGLVTIFQDSKAEATIGSKGKTWTANYKGTLPSFMNSGTYYSTLTFSYVNGGALLCQNFPLNITDSVSLIRYDGQRQLLPDQPQE